MSSFDPLRPSPILAPSLGKGWSGLVAWQDAGRAALVRKRPPSGKLNTPKNFTLPSRTQSGQKGIHKQSTHWAPRTSLQTVTWVEVKGSLKGWEVGTSLILGTWSLFSPLLSTRLSSSQVFHLHCSLWGKRDIHFFYSSGSSDDELNSFSFQTFVSVKWVKRDKAFEIADVHSKTMISIQFCFWLKSHFFCKYFHLFQMHS